MTRPLISTLVAAATALALNAPAQASLSGPELVQRIKQIQSGAYRAQDMTHVLCQYGFVKNDPFKVDLSFPTPAEYKQMTSAELSQEFTRVCCEVRQAFTPDWSCWYVQ